MIRPAKKNDASRLAEILIFTKRVTYRSIFNNDVVSFNEMNVLDLALHFQNEENTLDNYFVYDDGIVKGLIQFVKNDDVEIIELYVDPFFQKEGIGKALLDYCREMYPNKKIYLWVLEQNTQGCMFYEKNGFKYTGIKKLEEGTSEYIKKYETVG